MSQVKEGRISTFENSPLGCKLEVGATLKVGKIANKILTVDRGSDTYTFKEIPWEEVDNGEPQKICDSITPDCPVDYASVAEQVEDNLLGSNHQFNGEHAIAIIKALKDRGFKTFRSGSVCKVANVEDNLEKNGIRVNIVQSNFMGAFTELSISARA